MIADFGNNRVQELDREGRCIQVIGEKGTDDGCFQYPSDVEVDNEENVYVTDILNNRVQVFDKYGQFLCKFGQKGSGPGQLRGPCGLAQDKLQGLIYIAEHNNHRISVFTNKGEYQRHIGNATELKDPKGICLHKDKVLVSSSGSDYIVVYNNTGEKLHVFGQKGTGPGEFNEPKGLCVNQYGQVVACDDKNHRIQILDGSTGEVVRVFGSEGKEPGKVQRPYALTLTPSGKLVVSEFCGSSIQMLELQ